MQYLRHPLLERFTRADPLGIASADLTDPQSLNEYAYDEQ